MFRGITENPYKPEGKFASETTLKNITTQYSLGRPEWQTKWESNAVASFKVSSHYCAKFRGLQQPEEVKYQRAPRQVGNQICFGQDKVNFLSNTKEAFSGELPPNYTRARPVKDKASLQATNYTLGEDRVVYKTAAQSQFMNPKQQSMKEQPTYKNYNQRVDIITGQVYDRNKRSYGFEGFNEDPQHRRSQNTTNLPQDLYVTDVITGRRIIKKVKDDK